MSERAVAIFAFSEGKKFSETVTNFVAHSRDAQRCCRFAVSQFIHREEETYVDYLAQAAKWVAGDEKRCAIFLYGSELDEEAAEKNLGGITFAKVHDNKMAVAAGGPDKTRIIFLGDRKGGKGSLCDERIKACVSVFFGPLSKTPGGRFIIGPDEKKWENKVQEASPSSSGAPLP